MGTRGTEDRGRSAQALVEFAVVLPILLLLMIGLVNLGILVNAQIVLTQAAWEGARAGATIQDPLVGDDEITGAVRRAAAPPQRRRHPHRHRSAAVGLPER
jgi:Flp pilus assembly protein TadG